MRVRDLRLQQHRLHQVDVRPHAVGIGGGQDRQVEAAPRHLLLDAGKNLVIGVMGFRLPGMPLVTPLQVYERVGPGTG